MRARLVLAVLWLALAGPAAGQEKSRFVIVRPQPTAEAGLRGPLAMQPASAAPAALPGPEAPPPEAPAGLPVLPALSAPTSSQAARQCRSSCDRAYYFCLSGEDGECPTIWGRCRNGCGTDAGGA